jgi:DNA polymerase III epsilon subunit family exonuclease
MVPKQFVVVDLETTGLNAKTGDIVEIMALRVNRGSGRHKFFHAYVKPRRKISKMVARVIGITQDQIEAKGRPLDSVLRQFLKFAGEHRLVMFNADFDIAFLSDAASRNRAKIENPVSCALKMARRAWPGRRTYDLEGLAKPKGGFLDGLHHARRTCWLTASVYAAAASKLGRVT